MSWYTINLVPNDTISDLKFGPNNLFACTSWDGSITIVNAENTQSYICQKARAPVFSCSWSLDSVIAGGAERRLHRIDLTKQEFMDVGPDFDQSISCVSVQGSTAVAASFAKELFAVDLKSTEHLVIPNKSKIVSLDCHGHQLITADVENSVKLWDLRQPKYPLENRLVRTTAPLRNIKFMPNGNGYAVSNMQSRISVEYLDDTSKTSYIFKSNRPRVNARLYEAHAIYALAFDPTPTKSVLAVGGSDKGVSIWDTNAQVRTYHHHFPSSVMALDYSCDGKYLAAGLTEDRWRQDSSEFITPSRARIMIVRREDTCKRS